MNGIPFVVSAPSGAGKSSLLRELLPSDDGLVLSVSHTTRPVRPGEVDGEHYHFVDRDTFAAMAAAGTFLEYAEVFDHGYGTSEAGVRSQLASGKDVVLEIDWQGAAQVRQRFPDAVSIFILPPSVPALLERLRGRGQDSEETIARRMRDARAELAHYDEYDYLVVNDDFATALAGLRAIVVAERLRRERQRVARSDILADILEKG